MEELQVEKTYKLEKLYKIIRKEENCKIILTKDYDTFDIEHVKVKVKNIIKEGYENRLENTTIIGDTKITKYIIAEPIE